MCLKTVTIMISVCSDRALYLSDNEFEHLSPDIKNLKNLRILAIRDNDLVDVPQEIGELSGLRELHLQGNRLTVLPPSLGHLDFLSSRSILKLDNNPWVPPIEDQLMLGVSHVIEFIRINQYIFDTCRKSLQVIVGKGGFVTNKRNAFII